MIVEKFGYWGFPVIKPWLFGVIAYLDEETILYSNEWIAKVNKAENGYVVFTPWHIIRVPKGEVVVFDGEIKYGNGSAIPSRIWYGKVSLNNYTKIKKADPRFICYFPITPVMYFVYIQSITTGNKVRGLVNIDPEYIQVYYERAPLNVILAYQGDQLYNIEWGDVNRNGHVAYDLPRLELDGRTYVLDGVVCNTLADG